MQVSLFLVTIAMMMNLTSLETIWLIQSKVLVQSFSLTLMATIKLLATKAIISRLTSANTIVLELTSNPLISE